MALKNNLSGMRTYLVGAMDRVPDGGRGWRERITPHLEDLGIIVLDPCKKQIDNIQENEHTRSKIEFYKQSGQYDKIREEYGIIRNVDLRCVDISDFIIANIDMSIHMCGSYEEIVTANRQKKPVLIWCEQGKNKAPNWLFFMLPHENIFNSMEEIINHLQVIDSLEKTVQLERWLFFKDIK
ncbi:hypothetical protein EB118_00715 [bacterium]|nr:hypothetical protein [bacterium]